MAYAILRMCTPFFLNDFELCTCFESMATHVDAPLDQLCDSVYATSKSCRYTDVSIKLTEDKELVCVLSVGAKFVYLIHEFDTLSVEL